MKIAMDMRTSELAGGGIGRYHANLLNALRKIDKNNIYIEFFHNELISTNSNRFNNFIRRQLIEKRRLNKEKIDIFHTSYFDMFLSRKYYKILTIHDLAFFRYPEILPRYIGAYYRSFSKYAGKDADRIIAVSNSTKSDICRYLNIKEDKIDVIYEGGDHLIKYHPIINDEVLTRDKNHILFVGTIEPRKNLINLTKALKIVNSKIKTGVKLIIAGKLGYKGKLILETIYSDITLKKYVEYKGYVDDKLLTKLYKNAALFVLPSLYEGFGIPIAEAMQLGCPIVCSKNGALPEIAGKAGIYFDPLNVSEIAEIIIEVLESERIREILSIEGKERAKMFKWEKTAEETLNLYNNFKRC